MPLLLQLENIENNLVVRCTGRIVVGEEAQSLQREIESNRVGTTKRVVLNLERVDFIDSGGLGGLMKLSGALQSSRIELVLCCLPPFVEKVLQVTSLLKVLKVAATEKEALQGSMSRTNDASMQAPGQTGRVVCVDTSNDLLAFVSGLLKRSGFEVFTSSNVADARMLVTLKQPDAVVLGPGICGNKKAYESLRQADPKLRCLELPQDFSAMDAAQASAHLVSRLRELTAK